ncbi:MAG: response regulator [Deltaproteobacteria bacterium]|nr:response regulator [Deltaproteobacteria bacterium]
MALVFLLLTLVRGEYRVVPVLLGGLMVIAAAYVAGRRGHVSAAGYTLSLLVLVGVTAGALARGSTGYTPFFLPLGVVLAAATLAPRDVFVVTVVALLGDGALALWSNPDTGPATLANIFVEGALVSAVVGGMAILTSASIVRLVDDLRRRDAVARDAENRSDLLATELERAQRLESLARLAGGVAHDFNNLLTVMRGCATLLESEITPGTQAATDLRDLSEAVDRGAQLTRQLLSFSKRDVVQPALHDLHGAIEGMRGLLQRLVGPDVRITIDAAQGPWPVWAALSQIEQVVMNLAVNARDAMKGKGELLLRLERVADHERGGLARLLVKDTGEGMSDEVKARLFEPFFTTKGPQKGTGLGLATVHVIVTRLGGRVQVESSLGKGATFTVTLPLAAAHHVAAVPAPGNGRAPAALAVWVVDDEVAVRNQMARILGGAGMTVQTFSSAEALLAAGELVCDVVVTDVNLPGLSGVQLAEQLRARRPGLHVVLVSGFTADPSTTTRLLAEGVPFVAKPFQPAALVAAALGAPPPTATEHAVSARV